MSKVSYEIYYALGPNNSEYLFQEKIADIEGANKVVTMMEKAGKKGIKVVKVTRTYLEREEPAQVTYSDEG